MIRIYAVVVDETDIKIGSEFPPLEISDEYFVQPGESFDAADYCQWADIDYGDLAVRSLSEVYEACGRLKLNSDKVVVVEHEEVGA